LVPWLKNKRSLGRLVRVSNSVRYILAIALGSLAWGQAPTIDAIDFYGLHKVPESKVRQVLGAREGGPFPASKGETEERLDDISGVVESHLEAVCCVRGKTILYVGIEERGAPHFELREPPDGELVLPEEITTTYRRFLEASSAAARRGSTDEDLTRGHSRMADPTTRAVQDMFPALAKDHLVELRNVLRNAADEEQRATAAYVIAYAPKKKEILNDLQFALSDQDAGVRYNAAKGLVALAVLQRLDPQSDVKVEATWFIEMLNSLSWTDRNRALIILQTLTERSNPEAIDQLRERALPALIEMARWKTLEHALPAYILLGRVAGWSEDQIQRSWSRGDRDAVIVAASKKKK
jgi:hypothetical protein